MLFHAVMPQDTASDEFHVARWWDPISMQAKMASGVVNVQLEPWRRCRAHPHWKDMDGTKCNMSKLSIMPLPKADSACLNCAFAPEKPLLQGQRWPSMGNLCHRLYVHLTMLPGRVMLCSWDDGGDFA